MSVKQVKDDTFVDTDSLEGYNNIYPYIWFPSLERVVYGLFKTVGGPEDEEIDSVEVGGHPCEPIAPLTDFGMASDMLDSEYAFEEYPFVELEYEEDFNEAARIINKDADWEGPGVYDFRDMSKAYESVEEYESEALEQEADMALDFMFQGEEWQDAAKELSAVNKNPEFRERMMPGQDKETDSERRMRRRLVEDASEASELYDEDELEEFEKTRRGMRRLEKFRDYD